jgi:hypothetical protein
MIDIAYFLTVAAASDRLEIINNANGAANASASGKLLPLDTYEHNIIRDFPYLDSTTYKYGLLDTVRAQLLGINFTNNVNVPPAQNTTITNQSTSANYILSEAYNNSLVDAARTRLNVITAISAEEVPDPTGEPTVEEPSTEETIVPNYVSGDAYDNSLLEAALAKLHGLTFKEDE